MLLRTDFSNIKKMWSTPHCQNKRFKMDVVNQPWKGKFFIIIFIIITYVIHPYAMLDTHDETPVR